MTFSHTGMHTEMFSSGGGGNRWGPYMWKMLTNIIILAYEYLHLSTKTTQSSHRCYSCQADENSNRRTLTKLS